MVVAKKKRGRPPKTKLIIEKIRERGEAAAKKHETKTRRNAIERMLESQENRIIKLEHTLEGTINAVNALRKKVDELVKETPAGWVPHNGVERPIFGDTKVEVLLRSGQKNGPHSAFRYIWDECGSGTIVAYKVHS